MKENETRPCPYCGEEILVTARKCKHCGEWLEKKKIPCPVCQEEIDEDTEICPYCHEQIKSSETSIQQQATPVMVNVQRHTNGLGIAGFVLSLLGLFIPFVTIGGLIFSFLGLFWSPRGFAIAGTIISLVSLLVSIALASMSLSLLNLLF